MSCEISCLFCRIDVKSIWRPCFSFSPPKWFSVEQRKGKWKKIVEKRKCFVCRVDMGLYVCQRLQCFQRFKLWEGKWLSWWMVKIGTVKYCSREYKCVCLLFWIIKDEFTSFLKFCFENWWNLLSYKRSTEITSYTVS